MYFFVSFKIFSYAETILIKLLIRKEGSTPTKKFNIITNFTLLIIKQIFKNLVAPCRFFIKIVEKKNVLDFVNVVV